MTAHLDFDLLRSLVAVAETGALSKAAERVGRTQSALSMQMQRLEDVAGQPLLHRTARGVTLTAAGERLLAHARELTRHHDEALAELRGVDVSGVLRFSCPEDYAVVFLPHLLQGFASLHPRVQLEVVCAPTPRLHELLARHAVDLALVSVENADEPGVIRREPLVWVARRGSAVAGMTPLPLALGAQDALDHVLARRALEAVGREFRLAYASSSLAGLIGMARSGQAVTVLTRTSVPDDLEILDEDSGLPPLPVIGVTLASGRERPSPLTAAFAAHVRKVLPAA
ncbi:LysR family transcriptional regulator [Mitsuaria sp. 7]|uniref:LysR family transcriptional regulator n=1 Tax=Mitsuaria sp. 7 TaxID=1658665 RepID=UPI0007DCC7C9|nr:LysR family transcriptional regulator [Mitsuaria sp. 7]ANH67784.1 LysR family transcriptional regulator [Mitsuaria sp. 7]